MSKQNRNIAAGTVLALAIGYLIGILTAPKSGKETRQDIHDAALRAKREAERHLKELNSELSELIASATLKARSAKTKTQEEIRKAIDKAAVAKEKTREVLSAMHDGSADDKDLEKAVNEAQKAVDHLQTYLQK